MDAENKKKFWDGYKNKSIRYWLYIQTGLDLFNTFRYLLLAIAGLCIWLKLSHPIVFVVIFILSCVFLGCIGWIKIHKMGKTIDYLNIEFSSHWNRYSFELQERIAEAVEKLSERK